MTTRRSVPASADGMVVILVLAAWLGCARPHLQDVPASTEPDAAVVLVPASGPQADPPMPASVDVDAGMRPDAVLERLGPRRPDGTDGGRGFVVREGDTCGLTPRQGGSIKHENRMCCNGSECRGVCRWDPGWPEPRCLCAFREGGCAPPTICCGHTCARPEDCDRIAQ